MVPQAITRGFAGAGVEHRPAGGREPRVDAEDARPAAGRGVRGHATRRTHPKGSGRRPYWMPVSVS